MDRTTWAFVFISTTFVLPACAPRIRVIANPKPHQSGIRYYRPKPYLLVTSGQSAVTLEERPKTSTTTTVPDPRYVNIQLQYLPDFEEEYALDVRTGFGTADVGITLEDGWNLTSVRQNLDSQTDENIKAVSDLVGAIAKSAAATTPGDTKRNEPAPTFTIRATNVPLGYYESVIGRDGCGRKRLYGFRYIGFIPYASCPQAMGGVESLSCYSGELYGLVFEGDAMVFRVLSQIQQLDQFDKQFAAADSDATSTSNVERVITYDQAGSPSKATVTVTDSFVAEREKDGLIRIPLPKLDTPSMQGSKSK